MDISAGIELYSFGQEYSAAEQNNGKTASTWEEHGDLC